MSTPDSTDDRFGYPIAWTKDAIAGMQQWERSGWRSQKRPLLDAMKLAADHRFLDALVVLRRAVDHAGACETQLLASLILGAMGEEEEAAKARASAGRIDEALLSRHSGPIEHIAFVFTMPPAVGMMRVHMQMAEIVSELGYTVTAVVVKDTAAELDSEPTVGVKLVDRRADLVEGLHQLAGGNRLILCTAAWQTYAECVSSRVGPVFGFSAGDPGLNEPERASTSFGHLMSSAYDLPVTVVANTRYVQQTLLELFDRRAALLPVEVPNRFFEVCPQSGSGAFRVLVVGSPRVPHRNIATALDAVQSLRNAGHQVELVWLSPDPVSEPPEWATVHHAPPLESIPSIYAGCDALIYASSIEGLGLPPLEAMAVGVPVITTPVGGMAEFCRHDQNCLMVQPGDSDAIAASILRFMRSPELVTGLREQGLRTARTFARDAVRSRLGEILADPVADLSLLRCHSLRL